MKSFSKLLETTRQTLNESFIDDLAKDIYTRLSRNKPLDDLEGYLSSSLIKQIEDDPQTKKSSNNSQRQALDRIKQYIEGITEEVDEGVMDDLTRGVKIDQKWVKQGAAAFKKGIKAPANDPVVEKWIKKESPKYGTSEMRQVLVSWHKGWSDAQWESSEKEVKKLLQTEETIDEASMKSDSYKLVGPDNKIHASGSKAEMMSLFKKKKKDGEPIKRKPNETGWFVGLSSPSKKVGDDWTTTKESTCESCDYHDDEDELDESLQKGMNVRVGKDRGTMVQWGDKESEVEIEGKKYKVKTRTIYPIDESADRPKLKLPNDFNDLRLGTLYVKLHNWVTDESGKRPLTAPIVGQMLDSLAKVTKKLNKKEYAKLTGQEALDVFKKAIKGEFIDTVVLKDVYRKYELKEEKDMNESNKEEIKRKKGLIESARSTLSGENTTRIDETAKKNEAEEPKSGDSEAYKKFFKKALKKFGATKVTELGDKKDEFFDYVDANWESDKEDKYDKDVD